MSINRMDKEDVIYNGILVRHQKGEGNGEPLKYSCLENPMYGMKRQKDRTPEDDLPWVRRYPVCYWEKAEGNY